MYRKIFILTLLILLTMTFSLYSQETNSLFKETKIKNYLPHMTWQEAEDAFKKTDMVIVPVGSIEQHGKHLPLGTDSYAAIETAKLIAQKTDVIIAPVILAGLSEHHTGFPGSITLSPETFEAVLYETAASLMKYGVKNIMIYNGHGGNNVSVNNVIQKINQETSATAVFLNNIQLPPEEDPEPEIPLDWHAGVEETSLMLYLAGNLVQMSKAESSELILPDIAISALKKMAEDPSFWEVAFGNLFRPEKTGKSSSSREMSASGVFTTGNLEDSSEERGEKQVDRFVTAAVKFINTWKELSK